VYCLARKALLLKVFMPQRAAADQEIVVGQEMMGDKNTRASHAVRSLLSCILCQESCVNEGCCYKNRDAGNLTRSLGLVNACSAIFPSLVNARNGKDRTGQQVTGAEDEKNQCWLNQ